MKRVVMLLIVASIVSAGLLFLGITVMEQYTPALASSLGVLVADTETQVGQDGRAAGDDGSLAAIPGSSFQEVEVAAPPAPAADLPVDSGHPSVVLEDPASVPAADGPSTIAALFSESARFRNQVVTISGIATNLGNGKVLLNDGTGQIVVGVDDDRVDLSGINGRTVTVEGLLDDFSDPSMVQVDACTLGYQNVTILLGGCDDDDRLGGDDDGRGNDLDDDGRGDDRDVDGRDDDGRGGDDRGDDRDDDGGRDDDWDDDRDDDGGRDDDWDDDRDDDDRGGDDDDDDD